MSEEEARAAARALLESGHQFPGSFEFRVVVRPDAVGAVVSAIAATVGRPGEVDERRSSGGRWVSVRYKVEIDSADAVLEVYEVLRGMSEVVLTM